MVAPSGHKTYALGFTKITARGFDVARAHIQRARLLASGLTRIPGVTMIFDVADLTRELPEADASIDLTLCRYSVLSHLPGESFLESLQRLHVSPLAIS